MNEIFVRFRIWCVVGLLLTVYATYVELRAEKDADYVALCDISPKVSCTAVFTSDYGRGFGLTQHIAGEAAAWNPPNGAVGIAFYICLLALTIPRKRALSLLQVLLCLVANMLSVYLAYLLYFVLENLCVVCVSTYVVNYFCLVESWKLYKQLWCAAEATHKTNAQSVNNKTD